MLSIPGGISVRRPCRLPRFPATREFPRDAIQVRPHCLARRRRIVRGDRVDDRGMIVDGLAKQCRRMEIALDLLEQRTFPQLPQKVDDQRQRAVARRFRYLHMKLAIGWNAILRLRREQLPVQVPQRLDVGGRSLPGKFGI